MELNPAKLSKSNPCATNNAWCSPISGSHRSVTLTSISQNPQRFHEASTRFHHVFTAQGLLLLIGFGCQSFDMNSIGGWSTSWTSYWVLPRVSWCPIQTAVTTDSSAETSFTKRDPFWKLLSWAIYCYCVWHGEQLLLILVALMTCM